VHFVLNVFCRDFFLKRTTPDKKIDSEDNSLLMQSSGGPFARQRFFCLARHRAFHKPQKSFTAFKRVTDAVQLGTFVSSGTVLLYFVSKEIFQDTYHRATVFTIYISLQFKKK
jgi:hypothetical protein